MSKRTVYLLAAVIYLVGCGVSYVLHSWEGVATVSGVSVACILASVTYQRWLARKSVPPGPDSHQNQHPEEPTDS